MSPLHTTSPGFLTSPTVSPPRAAPARPIEQSYSNDLSRSRADALRKAASERLEAGQQSEVSGVAEPIKLVGGFGWWAILIVLFIVDFLGMFFTLTLFFAPVATFLGWFAQALVWLYCFTHGIKFFDKTFTKAVTYMISFIIETITFINFLPAVSIMFVVLRVLENHKREEENQEQSNGLKKSLSYAGAHHSGL